MGKPKYLLLILLLIYSSGMLKASHKTDIYHAYINNDMHAWEKVIDAMNQQKSKSKDLKLELLNYQYGYIEHCLLNNNKKTAEKYVKLGDEIISQLEETGYKPSSINAYKAAFYGFKVRLNFLKAPFLGPKGVECAVLSMKQDKNNPCGYIQYANAKYNMPETFGGSKSEAMKKFLIAEKLMVYDPKNIESNWNYISLLTMIGRAYTGLHDFQAAKAYYLKILSIEPNFVQVKNKLYPALLKQMK